MPNQLISQSDKLFNKLKQETYLNKKEIDLRTRERLFNDRESRLNDMEIYTTIIHYLFLARSFLTHTTSERFEN